MATLEPAVFSTEDLLALEDVFTIGSGFGIAAVYLVVRAVLSSPGALARRGRSDDEATVAAARDRVDALFGLGALGACFAFQAIGYALAVGGLGASDRTAARALMALTYAAAATGAVIALWKALGPRTIRQLLVEIARHDARTGERHPRPSTERLRAFGEALGYPPTPQETGPGGAAAYALRVFGVRDVVLAESKNPASAGLS
jgi:hypothetical protein